MKSPDVALRRRAIALLERAGTVAAPAQEDILLSLRDSDAEVRYLSVRALETMGASSPGVADALKVALNDSNVMVQTVARRVLWRIATEPIPAGGREPATTLAP